MKNKLEIYYCKTCLGRMVEHNNPTNKYCRRCYVFFWSLRISSKNLLGIDRNIPIDYDNYWKIFRPFSWKII